MSLNHVRNQVDKWFVEREMYPDYPLGQSLIVIPLLLTLGIGGVGYYGTASALFGAVLIFVGVGMWASRFKED